jgi:uncharacterized membrane protein
MSATAIDIDRVVGRLLIVGTYASVVLLGLGVAAMIATGTSPLDPAPPLDAGGLVGDIVALRPAGLLWLGLLVVIATPSARVAASLVGYLRSRDRTMAIVATLILCVIALSVVLAEAGR